MIIPPISTLTEQRDRLRATVKHLRAVPEYLARLGTDADFIDDAAATLTAIIEALQSPEGVEEMAQRHEVERDKLREAKGHTYAWNDLFLREITDLQTLARTLTLKVAAAEGRLAECFRQSGADPDGNEDWRLAKEAVQEVTRMRRDWDAAESLAQRERERADEATRLLQWLTKRGVGLGLEVHDRIDAFLAKGAPHG